MAIDDQAKIENTFCLHNGPLSEFYPDPADRAQFTHLGRARSYGAHGDSFMTDPNPLLASDIAEQNFIAEARRCGANIAFNVHSSLSTKGNDYARGHFVLITGDLYKRELK